MDKFILKKAKKNNYTSISNELLLNSNLSFAAKGMAVSLLARPDDWEISVPALMKEGELGRDKINKLINELVKHGYMYRKQFQGEKGRFTKIIFYISDEKEYLQELIAQSPCTDLPYTENTNTVAPLTENPYTEESIENKKKSTAYGFTVNGKSATTNNSSSYIKTTTANINNNKYIIELLEKHKISKGTIKNILNLTRDISEEEIAAALSKMQEKKWGEGALYKALKEEWIRSEEKIEAEQSTEKINGFIQGIYNQQLAYLELYGYKNSSKLQAIENFEERIKKINPDYLNTEYYKKFLQRLENIAVTNDKEPISSPFQAEQKRFLKNFHRIGGHNV
ncbi:MAG: hypothetical protein SOW67_05760 [Fusobacterium necrophorum]|nr:hypothetical protein [Fusobacterium necrophorum]